MSLADGMEMSTPSIRVHLVHSVHAGAPVASSYAGTNFVHVPPFWAL
jgi:hypothetical protein